MTTSSIQHKLRINSVPFTDDVPTRVNIKKRRERVFYKTLSNQNNINISYLMGQSLSPSNNLFISDRSTSLTQNRIPVSLDYTVVTSKSLSLNVEKFYVTDQFTTETPTKAETPLFLVHTLEYYNSSLANFSNMTLLSLEFNDYDLRAINFTEYVFDSDTGSLYSNIENTYDDSDGSFDITFVKYTVKIVDGISQIISVYHELINNKPVYKLADFDDLDEFGNIIVGKKRYLIEQIPGTQTFSVILPVVAQYAYKEESSSRIKILEPTAVDISVPWNIRVTNGQFIASLQKTISTYLNHKYYIPEFNSQLFNPYPPFKQQIEQRATWLTENLFFVPKNIYYDLALSLYIDVIIKDRYGDVKYAYSNNPDKVGTIYSGTIRYTEGIASRDGRGGFLEFTDKIRDDDVVKVSYYTEEDQFEFTSIDFNPVNNLNNLIRRVVVYVRPETVSTGTLDESIFYLLVDQLGRITYCSQADQASSSTVEPSSKKLLSEDFDSSGNPKHVFYYDIESTTEGLNSRINLGIGLDYVSEFSFIDKYTVESVLLNSTTFPTGYAADNFTDNSRFLVLGDIYVGENERIDGLSQFEVRVRGGGIKEEYESAAILQQPQIAWYWDFNSNRPYPGAGSFMVEVPQTLLTDYDGSFTRDQIVAVINRHMAMGGWAILKTWGIDPHIISLSTTSSSITVGWPTYGSATTYDIYYSLELDGVYTKINTSTISDASTGNTYLISGLKSSTKYYIKIVASDSSSGPVVSGTTLAEWE